MFEASEALQKMEGMKKIKSTSFHQYSWNSEVETTWISLIGWHHKTSSTYIVPSHYKLREVVKKVGVDSVFSVIVQDHLFLMSAASLIGP